MVSKVGPMERRVVDRWRKWARIPSHEFLEAQMTVFSLWVQRMRSTPYFLLSTVLVVLRRRVSDNSSLQRETRGRKGPTYLPETAL
jgi:hypothetical protein